MEVGRVVDFGRGDESLLDTPGLNESVEDGSGSSLVVGSRSSSSSERLLSDDGTGRFVVVVHHTGSVSEEVGGLEKSISVGGEAVQSNTLDQRCAKTRSRRELKTYMQPVKA